MKQKTITKLQAQKWATALRSGEYKQTRSYLQDKKGFCCLGVACKLFIPKNKLQYNAQKLLVGNLPIQQNNSPEWLNYLDDNFSKLIGWVRFTDLNDNGVAVIDFNDLEDEIYRSIYKSRFTFNEIADLIELVYVHKMLK